MSGKKGQNAGSGLGESAELTLGSGRTANSPVAHFYKSTPMQVIFDTNAYRQLAAGRSMEEVGALTKDIRKAEDARGVMALVSPVVWMELFVHLADAADPHFSECLGAVVSSYLHSRGGDDGPKFRLMHWPFMIAAETLFGFKDVQLDTQVASMDRLAGLIYGSPTLDNIQRYRIDLDNCKRYATDQELAFIARFNEVKDEFLANHRGEKDLGNKMRSVEFVDRLSEFEMIKIAQTADVVVDMLDGTEYKRLVQMIRDYFPAPSFLFIDIMSRLVGSKTFDIEKGSRRNWYWDYQMLFHVSWKTSFYLITDDSDIKGAATAAGVGDKIKTLGEYLAWLQSPPGSLADALRSRVVKLSIPDGEEVNVSDLARMLGISAEDFTQEMRNELAQGPVRTQQVKNAVRKTIHPFYDDAVGRFGLDGNKPREILDVGKFIFYNQLQLQLLEVSESPDFILGLEGKKIGLEHTQLFDKAGQHRLGKTVSLLEETSKYIGRVAPDVVGLFNISIATDGIMVNNRSFIDLPKVDLRWVAEVLGAYIISYFCGAEAERPSFLEGMVVYQQATLNLVPGEDFIRRGIDKEVLLERITRKEAKIDRYKANGDLSECWLLIIYVSAISSSSFHVRAEDLPVDRVLFDRIFLMDSFSGKIIEGKRPETSGATDQTDKP